MGNAFSMLMKKALTKESAYLIIRINEVVQTRFYRRLYGRTRGKYGQGTGSCH